jgi:hypothetical protein
MAKDEKFMFYETFMRAIDTLPEDKRAEACYLFCRYGIYGELPEDDALKMFCIGVSCSVRKYQGRGGSREGAGRPSKENQKNQKNQKNQNEQTQTQTQTKTQTKTINIKPNKKEIKDYCDLLGKHIDIDSFMAYYEASNWEDKNGMQINWRQKVISWSMKQKQEEDIYNPNRCLF